MKIARVIEKVDEWQPNVFTLQDKLDWCYEVTRDILAENPEYGSITKTAPGGPLVVLPEGVSFADVAYVYVNGKKLLKTDERTYGDMVFERGDEVYIVYRTYPAPYEAELSEDGEGHVPDDLETIVPPPYDSMYIDYVCAQIAFQQNDAAEYGKFIDSFQTKFYAYRNVAGANSPISEPKNFVKWF